MNKDQPKNRIREEFEEKYARFTVGEYSEEFCPNSGKKEPVIDFFLSKIAELLKSQRDSLVEKIEIVKEKRDIYSPAYVSGFNDALDKILSLLKEE